MRTIMAVLACTGLSALAASSAQANLLTNGNFSASTSTTATPTGWTQLGPSNGVIADSSYGTPSYMGTASFYDFGGYGDVGGTQGDGIEQTIATLVGTSYVLTFGLSDENAFGTTTLQVNAGPSTASYTQTANGSFGLLQYPWTTETVGFTATSTLTLISFVESSATLSNGSNDPLIAGVDVEVGTSATNVPEPPTVALLGLGLAGLCVARRRRAR